MSNPRQAVLYSLGIMSTATRWARRIHDTHRIPEYVSMVYRHALAPLRLRPIWRSAAMCWVPRTGLSWSRSTKIGFNAPGRYAKCSRRKEVRCEQSKARE